MELKDLSSNWKKLQASLEKKAATAKADTKANGKESRNVLKRKHPEHPTRPYKLALPKLSRRVFSARMETSNLKDEGSTVLDRSESNAKAAPKATTRSFRPDRINEGLSANADVGRYVAIDCEMVGVGPLPDRESALARISVVNYDGDQIYDSYVKPKEQVTDWRTPVSGITSKHMVEARTLEEVQKDIASMLDGKILVGHAIRNDLDALMLSHPRRDIRDTARHPPFRKYAGGGSPRLKVLASVLLGLDIQNGEHSSVEDARAAMLLFRQDKDAFEREHARKWPSRPQQTVVNSSRGEEMGVKKKHKPKKKKKKRS